MEIQPVHAALLGVAVTTALGLAGFFWSGFLTPSAAAAKLWDRVHTLDQVLLSHPDAYLVFMREAGRATAYFYGNDEVPRDASFVKVKGIVYLHLNVFEEVYLTVNASRLVARRLDAKGWERWILLRMRHPLLKEIFQREWCQYDPHARFDRFINKNKTLIDHPCDPDLW